MGAGAEAGVVKYEEDFRTGPAPEREDFEALEPSRRRLRGVGLIGVYPNGIGYGNLSRRSRSGFVITGTGTGRCCDLVPEQYTRVIACDEARHRVVVRGPVRASSEAMTHAVVYRLLPAVGAVAHVHHGELWRRACGRIPTTAASAAYGTSEMARAVADLLGSPDSRATGCLAMAGHEEGLLGFGETPAAAVSRLFALADLLGVPLAAAPCG